MNIEHKNCKTIIFFGGPSNERNISLDSARTFYDSIRHHLLAEHLTLIFVSRDGQFYRLHPNWIYSNTIEDFEDLLQARKLQKKINSDIKLHSNLRPNNTLNNSLVVGEQMSTLELNKLIDESHAFFPLIHGAFGEDGVLTKLLQKRGRKSIIGSPPDVLYTSFKKHLAHKALQKLEMDGYAYLLVKDDEWEKDRLKIVQSIKSFVVENKKVVQNGVVIKPNDCGSSDGVSVVEDALDQDAIKVGVEYALKFSKEVLVEERIVGKEFSLIVFEDFNHQAVALFPTEIVITSPNNSTASARGGFYSRQKKYMPGSGVDHITPARLPHDVIDQIRSEAQIIFKKLGFQDWARFDGFYIPSSKNPKNTNKDRVNGKVVWSDLNSQPGIGQDSLLFQQSIYLGIDTYNVSMYLLRKALAKEKVKLIDKPEPTKRMQMVGVLGGGATSERQVSRMSWCNVIEKLDRLKTYNLRYLFLDKNNHLWEVPRPYTLKHTTEEIERLLKNPLSAKLFPSYEQVYKKIKTIFPEAQKESFHVKKLKWSELTRLVDYLFISLHGGIGENGTLQKRLTQLRIPYNGSDGPISKLCFDKRANYSLIAMVREINTLKRDYGSSRIYLPRQATIAVQPIKTALAKKGIHNQDINTLATHLLENPYESNQVHSANYKAFSRIVLDEIAKQLKTKKSANTPYLTLSLSELTKSQFVIKPSADGCSTGVVVCADFKSIVPRYFLLLMSKYRLVPADLFDKSHDDNVDKSKKSALTIKGLESRYLRLSGSDSTKILFEEFLDVKKGYIELTVGVMGERGKMIALLPSKTIAETQILSLDEKFNKGVGPNLTPPRELNIEQIATIRAEVADFANKIGLKDYARIDLFYHPGKNELYLIEVNTLPGLTAATILFTQVLVTPQAQFPPSEFLDKIITFSQK